MMKDENVVFDRRYHVIYSKECKAEILNKIALYYPKEQVDEVFEAVQLQYSDYLKDYRTDLGGKANFHMTLDSSTFGIEGCANLIYNVLQ